MNSETNFVKAQRIPVFYACDEGFVKYAIVSMRSLIENASKQRRYSVYLLHTDISEQSKQRVKQLECDNVQICFVDVKEQIEKTNGSLPLRDYYSKTTYFRFYIADLFPQYDKAIYVDSDTVVLGDIADLFDSDIGDSLVGACNEQVMVQTDLYGTYVEKVLGISRMKYFNAGVMVINTKQFRAQGVLNRFIDLLSVYSFKVTQDEDYLNVLCKDKVFWLDQGWNTEVYGDIPVEEKDFKILHYIMTSKPWHYRDCQHAEYFWRYAELTDVFEEIKAALDGHTDEEKQLDAVSCVRLAALAEEECKRIDRYAEIIKSPRPDRLKVLERIRRYEIEKKFDVDVEDDPETIVLTPDKVDYLGEKLSSRLATRIANHAAVAYYEKQIKKGNLIIKDIVGLENFKAIKGGFFITCNHFSPNDNYVVWRAIRGEFKGGKRLYKVIREGNYTNFKGLYGFFFRHCNTLPLSSNIETMSKFLNAVKELISRGEKILIYPEQAMWWNYKKPRPLKNGAFRFAAKLKVPVLPCFITMEDSGRVDDGGFAIPALTAWFLPAIYPKEGLTDKENTAFLRDENFRVWKELYERVYGVELKYGE